MRLTTTLAILLGSGSTLFAQVPKLEPLPEKKAPVEDEKLNGLLRDWEAKMNKIDRFMVDCDRVKVEATRKKTFTATGQSRYLKPNFAMLDLKSTEDKDDRELFVSNGEKLYEFKIREKMVVIHEMPKTGMAEENTFMNFLFGMKPEDAKRRYDLSLKKAVDGEGYIYINILPKNNGDKQEFEQAQLVLYSKWIGEIGEKNPARADWALLPARLWFKEVNGNTSTWSFVNYDLKANLTKDSFLPPKWPTDWKTEVVRQGPAVAPKDPFPKKGLDLPPLVPKSKLSEK